MGRAQTTSIPLNPWAAPYNTGLLIELMPKGIVFFLSFFHGLAQAALTCMV